MGCFMFLLLQRRIRARINMEGHKCDNIMIPFISSKKKNE